MSNKSSFFQESNSSPSPTVGTSVELAASANCSSLFQETNPTPSDLASVDSLVSGASANAVAANASALAALASQNAASASQVAAAASAVTAAGFATGLTIGTVTVGSAGATITGSPGAQHLNLTIPSVPASTAPANEFATGITAGGALTYAQPTFGNLSGAASLAQLPSIPFTSITGVATAAQLPPLSGLAGVLSAGQVPLLSALGGSVTASQVPALSALSGSVLPAQLPAPTATTLGGVESGTAAANQFMTGISTAGAPTFATLTSSNVTAALGFTPLSTLTSAQVTTALGYTPLSGITSAQVTGALGYTPVHTGWNSNVIYIGWDGANVDLQVDASYMGAILTNTNAGSYGPTFAALGVNGATTLHGFTCYGNSNVQGSAVGGVAFEVYNGGIVGAGYYSTNLGAYGYISASGSSYVQWNGVTVYGAPLGVYTPYRMCASEFDANSDLRLKHSIEDLPLDRAWDFVTKARPVIHEWNDPGQPGKRLGFIAQDLVKGGWEEIIGLTENDSLEETIDDDGFLSPKGAQFSVSYDKIVTILTAALADTKKQLDAALVRIEALEDTCKPLT